MRRSLALLACSGAVVLALTGCGQRKVTAATGHAQPLRVAVPSGEPGDAPVYGAMKTGAFRQAGLKVTLRQAAGPAAAVQAVVAGQADLALAGAPDVLEARDRGQRVVSVASLTQGPATALVHVGAPKAVGAGADWERALAKATAPGARIVAAPGDPAAALSARKPGLNAVVAPSSLVFDRRLHGKKAAAQPLRAPSFDGVVLVANADALDRDADLVRGFLGALARTTKELRAGKAGPLAGLYAAYPGIDHSKSAQAARQTFAVPPPDRPYGWQEQSRWSGFAGWMRGRGLLHRASAGAPFTNDELPGEGLKG